MVDRSSKKGVEGVRGTPICNFIRKNDCLPALEGKVVGRKAGGFLLLSEDGWQFLKNRLFENVINSIARVQPRDFMLDVRMGTSNVGGGGSPDWLEDGGHGRGTAINAEYDQDKGAADFWMEVEVWYYQDPTTNGHI
jgi:hypothetical protein